MTTQSQTQIQVKAWLRAAAVAAAVVIGAADAGAQFRSNNQGQALDASNRVGSGGSNGQVSDNRVGVSGNQIVTGNVTGGREFRGPLGYSDAREFRGSLGSDRSDAFVRDSNGARRSPTLLQTPTAYYGSRLAEPLPSNYAPTVGSTGGYTMTGAPVGNQMDNSVGLAGVRPGAAGTYAGTFDQRSPAMGDLQASPLFGVRAAPNQSPGDLRNDPLYSTTGDARVTTDRQLQQMREELTTAVQGKTADNIGGANETGNANGNGKNGINLRGNGPGGGPEAGVGNTAIVTPLGSPLKNDVGSPISQLRNNGLDSQMPNGAVSTGVQTGQTTEKQLIVPPAQQSAQYKELVRRMENRPGTTEGQQTADFNRLRAAQAQGKQPGQPGDAQPGAPGAATPMTPAGGGPVNPRPGVPLPAAAPAPAAKGVAGPAVPTEPLEIKSLATGVTARGLAGLLTSAEQSMKDQKYADAVAKYMQASRVAPNNPMITLGSGIAQLGGANYGQAEVALRRAITSEPALLMGRYDLTGWMGEARVKFLQKDLKQLAAASPTELRPRLLLAFLSYNIGNGPDAEKYITDAVKLAPNDPVVQAMQKTLVVLPVGEAKPDGASAPAPAATDLNNK
jgi:hypothetical protein